MASVGDILNDDDDFVRDVFDTPPKESTDQHKKQECLKGAIDKGKFEHKWAHERVDKESDENQGC